MVDVPLRGCITGKGTLISPTIMNGRLSEIFRKPCQERHIRSLFFLSQGLQNLQVVKFTLFSLFCLTYLEHCIIITIASEPPDRWYGLLCAQYACPIYSRAERPWSVASGLNWPLFFLYTLAQNLRKSLAGYSAIAFIESVLFGIDYSFSLLLCLNQAQK